MMPYAGSETAPIGWLICDGQEISRATYADLFAAINVYYGAGNFSTTFNVPDTRGRSLVGVNVSGLPNGLNGSYTTRNKANTGGAEAHTITHAELPSTVHEPTTTVNTVGGEGSTGWQGIAQSGAGDSHENMQPFVVVNYIIKT